LIKISDFLKDSNIMIKRWEIDDTDWNIIWKKTQTYLTIPWEKNNFSINDTDVLNEINIDWNTMTLNFVEESWKRFNISFEKNEKEITTTFLDENNNKHSYITKKDILDSTTA
jgi:hypothetical protein